MKTIYLAGGCFWGLEKYFSVISGITHTTVGYANGKTTNPTYEQVCHENTDHAETIEVQYDPTKITLIQILDMYFDVIDPISMNRQGYDIGRQYRTGIYYINQQDFDSIKNYISAIQVNYDEPIATEVKPLENFYKAEEYHQKYLDKNPGGYCHISFDSIEKAKQKTFPVYNPKTKAELKEILTPLQYQVTQENGTEAPYDNEYDQCFEEGIYVDITTGQPLFISTDKFESGCGWPSFSKPIDDSLLEEVSDHSHGMKRVEVRSQIGDAHLGHVFNDGPNELGGLRYCINSASLRFIPKENMLNEGYEAYIPLLST